MSTSLTPAEYARRARVYAAAKKDLAELTRLRAENARLREGAQDALNLWHHNTWDDPDRATLVVAALRAALKEGGGE